MLKASLASTERDYQEVLRAARRHKVAVTGASCWAHPAQLLRCLLQLPLTRRRRRRSSVRMAWHISSPGGHRVKYFILCTLLHMLTALPKLCLFHVSITCPSRGAQRCRMDANCDAKHKIMLVHVYGWRLNVKDTLPWRWCWGKMSNKPYKWRDPTSYGNK